MRVNSIGTIPGSTVLPAGFAHPHASEEARRLSGSPAVPAEPDRRWVDDWLHRSHLNYWHSQVPD